DAKLNWEAGKPMLVHCTDCGLVSLGKAKRRGYEMRVKIRQETWHGCFGVYLGYHRGKDAGGTFCEYQLIKLHRTVIKGKQALIVQRCLAKEFEFNRRGRPREVFVAADVCDLPPNRYCELSFKVDDKGIHSASWDGQDLPEVGADAANEKLK